MPNTWTKAIQALNEKFQGPRTNDSEIKLKLDKAETIDKSLKSLKNIISNFSSYFEKILSYNREISECIFILFDNNQEFKELAEILTQVHVDNNKLFSQITNDVVDLSKKTEHWPNYFEGLKTLDLQREETRKIYDHYEKKLEKLNDEKEKKVKRGAFQENSTFAKKLERNEEKFVTSKKKYIDNCIELYDKVDNLLNDRFSILNPVLLKLFYIEMRIYESFNSKFTTYKNLEEKFNVMKTNFERKERVNDYDPQKFMKNPNIEDNFENRKFAMVEYRKSVHARSKSQTRPNNNNNANYNANQNKFHQVSNLDEPPGRKGNNPLSQKDAFFFEDDNAVNDFNKIDNNFSNFNLKAKDANNTNNKHASNLKPNIPMPRMDHPNDKAVAFLNSNNGFNNSFNIQNNKFNNNFSSSGNNSNNNNSFNAGAFNFFSGSNNNNSGNGPVLIKGDGNNVKNESFKAIDDFNEIFGNANLNNNLNNNQFNYGNSGLKNNNNNNFSQNNRGTAFDFGFNNEANVVLETQNDFGGNNALNMFGNNNGNMPNTNALGSNLNNFNNFEFQQIEHNNHHQMGNNNSNNINRFNNQQANPGVNSIDLFNNPLGGGMQYAEETSSYPTLDNVLDNNNFSNQAKNQNFSNYNPTNIVPVQSSIVNINLNNFNSGMGPNSGNNISTNKRSSAIYFKNQGEDFENILNNSKQNQKANKDSDPFEGYY